MTKLVLLYPRIVKLRLILLQSTTDLFSLCDCKYNFSG